MHLVTAVRRNPSASAPLPDNVVRLPVRPESGPMGACITLARLHGAWRRNNPHATVDEDLAAGDRIAKELGL